MAGSPSSSIRGGFPLGLAGAVSPTRYVGGTAAAAPASGTFAVGDFVITATGKVYVCTVAGSPGTWTQAGGAGGTTEVGYDQVTVTVAISGTTEATGDTVITCAAHTFDGNPVIATFFCPNAAPGGSVGASLLVSLFEGATQIGRLAYVANPAGAALALSLVGMLRFTPTAAAHTYTVTAVRAVANGNLVCGSGGTGGWDPMFIRFTTAA